MTAETKSSITVILASDWFVLDSVMSALISLAILSVLKKEMSAWQINWMVIRAKILVIEHGIACKNIFPVAVTEHIRTHAHTNTHIHKHARTRAREREIDR